MHHAVDYWITVWKTGLVTVIFGIGGAALVRSPYISIDLGVGTPTQLGERQLRLFSNRGVLC